MSEDTIRFTQHAMKRARERKLWKYVNKKKVFYDAQILDLNKYILDYCVYVAKWDNGYNRILTMYSRTGSSMKGGK